MPPTAPALAQSDSKSRFMRRLGLDEGNKMHRYLYSLMKVCKIYAIGALDPESNVGSE